MNIYAENHHLRHIFLHSRSFLPCHYSNPMQPLKVPKIHCKILQTWKYLASCGIKMYKYHPTTWKRTHPGATVAPWVAACVPPWPRDAPSTQRVLSGAGSWGLENYFWKTSWAGLEGLAIGKSQKLSGLYSPWCNIHIYIWIKKTIVYIYIICVYI